MSMLASRLDNRRPWFSLAFLQWICVLGVAAIGCNGNHDRQTDSEKMVRVEPVDLNLDHSLSADPLLTNGPGKTAIGTVICNDVGIGSGIRLQVVPNAQCGAARQYPHLHMGLFDRDFRSQPEGYWHWPEHQADDETENRLRYIVNGWYCRSEDDCQSARVAIYIGTWNGERYGATGWSDEPEQFIGRSFTGWYVVQFEDGTQMGNSMTGIWCGQNWDYCD